jgi:hypothetical protein
MRLAKLANKVVAPLGIKIVRKNTKVVSPGADPLFYQHSYEGGYDTYKAVQTEANKRKFDNVWSEERTLESIASYIEKAPQVRRRGLCHGARNGWEVQWLKNRLNCEVIGTDISETANSLEDMVQHDFHHVREDWIGEFSFIYTNSLDQAFDPATALNVWAKQIGADGLIFIEHTMHHSPSGASEMDPFGAHPMIMPYLFFEWGRGEYELADILKLGDVQKGEQGGFAVKRGVWVFVLRKPRDGGSVEFAT